jgi:hypothetical protein
VRRLVFALCVGAAAALCGLLVGVSQPGSWVVAGSRARAYDIFILDHYFIVRPAVIMVNLVAFAIAAYALMELGRLPSRGRNGGAGA